MQNCFNTNTSKGINMGSQLHFRIAPISNPYFPIFPEVLLVKLGFQCKLQEINFLFGTTVFQSQFSCPKPITCD